MSCYSPVDGGAPAESGSGDGNGGTKGAEGKQEITTGPTDQPAPAPPSEIPPTTTPPPSPTSVTKLTITGTTQLTTTQPQEDHSGASEENAVEYHAVYPTYAEEDGTNEPLLRKSPGQDTSSHRTSADQDGAGGNTNTTEEQTEELTERTCLFLPDPNT